MNRQKQPYSVLFAEDEKLVRERYLNHIKREFKTVYHASNGDDAYKIYLDKKPSILIMDISMPGLNGIEVLQKIRENDHTTKAIVLTAHSDKKNLLNATSLKLTKYLVKPVTRQELKEALELAVNELKQFNTISKKILKLKEGYHWDIELSILYSNNKEIELTPNERKIASILFTNINNVITYDDLIIQVWDNFEKDIMGTLKSTIKNLRKKLPNDTIKNIFKMGYKVELF